MLGCLVFPTGLGPFPAFQMVPTSIISINFILSPQNLGDTNSTQFVNLSGGGMMESCDHVTQQKYVSVCSFQDSRLGREQAAINPISYKGSVCWEELSSLKSCLLSDDSSENSHPLVVTIDGEGDAELALSAVDTFASPECAVEVKPFLCLYFFGLMSDTSYNVYYQPSAEHCVNLRDDVCEMEWNLAQVLISGLKLPDCNEQLPSRIEPCNENQEGGLGEGL